jgi:hypothetical protein
VDVVSGLIELVMNLLAQVLVVDLIIIFAFLVGTEFLGQFLLQQTHRLDSLVSSLQGTDQVLLRNFLHLAFHHHDVVFGGNRP